MKVKIGDDIFDSNDQPIMVIFDQCEKDLVSNMKKDDKRFCSCPEGSSPQQIRRFMHDAS